MASFRVRCVSCERQWHSATMADGLRLVGACPRCGGKLLWAGPAEAYVPEVPAGRKQLSAPHLVLGPPRR